ncbi:hypothetical protein ONR57_19630 [Hoyosella sp. YIM 151337]|uniref:hypothetical protein n=1 Tax=Hoyosella sp. YIM 151337 TaxID=2992742 RepID=UPI002235CDCC|nr:hypothetical protein [Hoyosella sp. YIM 151337]MCW4355519.1 hypothetical protein [Hoyosella sp. YIM 151337]
MPTEKNRGDRGEVRGPAEGIRLPPAEEADVSGRVNEEIDFEAGDPNRHDPRGEEAPGADIPGSRVVREKKPVLTKTPPVNRRYIWVALLVVAAIVVIAIAIGALTGAW